MSLVHRKPRPLVRDADALRDTKLFLVACDDTYAPKQYFDFFRITRVQVKVIATTDGTSVAKYVLDRLLEFDFDEDDERWLLLDTDHCAEGPHIKGFMEALKRASDNGVKVALSKPCFELWLLLHHVDESAAGGITCAADVAEKLRAAKGEYNKIKLKSQHYPLSTVADACERAARLEAVEAGILIPTSSMTRVHHLWRAIAEKALWAHLPDELKRILIADVDPPSR